MPDKNNNADSIDFEGIISLDMCRRTAVIFINQGQYDNADYDSSAN